MISEKERALEKLNLEIRKDIRKLIDSGSNTCFSELLYFAYLLHTNRLRNMYPDIARGVSVEMMQVYTSLTEETLKYLIQICVKFGLKRYNSEPYNHFLISNMIQSGNILNSKYESKSLIDLFEVEVYGERDRYLKLDMKAVNSNDDVKRFFDYFIRIDRDNTIKKSKERYPKFLVNFEKEYKDYEDLFEQEMGIELNQFVQIYKFIIDTIIERGKKIEPTLPTLPNGNINDLDFRSFIKISNSYIFDQDEIQKHFGLSGVCMVGKLIFSSERFNPNELRYYELTRRPIIRLSGKQLLVSPELMLDSLFTNTHYSLLESSTRVKEEYKQRYADKFLDSIAKIADKHGFREYDRNINLYEGKNMIGDIDLLVKNDNNQHLLIEAKNHALPLSVYFKDLQSTQAHLRDLKEKWEKKVLKRQKHLDINYEKYGIGSNFKYIVVSRFPEIISHYSNLLILSLYEFETWMEDGFSYNKTFADIYSIAYASKNDLSSGEIHQLKEIGHIPWSENPFSKLE